jgi:hypothetical protein
MNDGMSALPLGRVNVGEFRDGANGFEQKKAFFRCKNALAGPSSDPARCAGPQKLRRCEPMFLANVTSTIRTLWPTLLTCVVQHHH